MDRVKQVFRTELEAAIESLRADLEVGEPEGEGLERALRAAHSLKGGAEMIGLDGLAASSRRLERLLRDFKATGAPPVVALRAALRLLRADAEGAAGLLGGPDDSGATAASAPQTHPRRVLVVDDLATARLVKSRILEAAGFEVQQAADGNEALLKLEEGDFDLVLSDVEMPVLDGLALTREIRSHPRFFSLPVVLLSGHGSESDHARGRAAGANAYVSTEGFNPVALVATVKDLLP